MKLKWFDYLILLILIAIVYIFTATQKFYIPEVFRPFTMSVVVLIMLFLFFIRVRPDKPFNLSLFLSIFLGIFVSIIIIVEVIFFNFKFSYKHPVIFVITIIIPFISGLIYKAFLVNFKRKH